MEIKKITIDICASCLNGEGSECHTPECSLFSYSVSLPIHKEIYEVISEYEIDDNNGKIILGSYKEYPHGKIILEGKENIGVLNLITNPYLEEEYKRRMEDESLE